MSKIVLYFIQKYEFSSVYCCKCLFLFRLSTIFVVCFLLSGGDYLYRSHYAGTISGPARVVFAFRFLANVYWSSVTFYLSRGLELELYRVRNFLLSFLFRYYLFEACVILYRNHVSGTGAISWPSFLVVIRPYFVARQYRR